MKHFIDYLPNWWKFAIVRSKFEDFYIGKHLHQAMDNKEYSYRMLKKHLSDDWMGHKYKDADIENSWQQFQREIEQ